MEKLREQYVKEVIPALMKKFDYKSVMQVPKLDKIVINIGLGDTKENPKALENAVNDLMQITGQKPMITKAKKSIAAFSNDLGFSFVSPKPIFITILSSFGTCITDLYSNFFIIAGITSFTYCSLNFSMLS